MIGDRYLREGLVWTVADVIPMHLGFEHRTDVLVLRCGSSLRVATAAGLASRDWPRLP